MDTDEAYKQGLRAGHAAYEGNSTKNPYPLCSDEYYRWLDGWTYAFESAEFNDEG